MLQADFTCRRFKRNWVSPKSREPVLISTPGLGSRGRVMLIIYSAFLPVSVCWRHAPRLGREPGPNQLVGKENLDSGIDLECACRGNDGPYLSLCHCSRQIQAAGLIPRADLAPSELATLSMRLALLRRFSVTYTLQPQIQLRRYPKTCCDIASSWNL